MNEADLRSEVMLHTSGWQSAIRGRKGTNKNRTVTIIQENGYTVRAEESSDAAMLYASMAVNAIGGTRAL